MTVHSTTISGKDFTPFSILKPLEAAHWDRSTRAELQSLREETDPEIFWSDLLHLGRRLKKNGKNSEALALLGYLQSRHSEIPESVAIRVRGEYEAMVGRGPLGARLEFLGGQFFREVIQPKNILPLMAGTVGYQLARTGTLARLAQGGRGLWALRGLSARAFAGGVGFLAEVPVFVSVHRGIQYFSGEAMLPWTQELSHAARTLGILKFFGFLGSRAFYGFNRISELTPALELSPIPRVGRFLIPQTAMVGGLMAASAVEAKIQGAPLGSADHLLLNALSTVATYGLAGRLGQGLLGTRWAQFQLEMGLRNKIYYEALEQPQPPPTKITDLFAPAETLLGMRPQLAGVSGNVRPSFSVPENFSAMAGLGDGGSQVEPLRSSTPEEIPLLEDARAPFRRRNEQRAAQLQTETDPEQRALLEKEGEVLKGLAEAPHLRDWFEGFPNLRIFYLVQGRSLGREFSKVFFTLEKEMIQRVHEGNLYHLLIQNNAEGIPYLRLPSGHNMPPVLRLEQFTKAPSILLTGPFASSRLSPRLFRLDDLDLHQPVVSKKGVADYRQLMREGGKIHAINVVVEPNRAPFIYDGYHRFYAAKLEGYSHILGTVEKYYNQPESRPFTFEEIKMISHKRFLRLVAKQNPPVDPFKAYIMGDWDDAILD